MTRKFCLIALFAFCSLRLALCIEPDIHRYAGTSSFDFLKLSLSPEARAAGGLLLYSRENVFAVLDNPANINHIDGLYAGAYYTKWFFDMNLQMLALNFVVRKTTFTGVFSLQNYGTYLARGIDNNIKGMEEAGSYTVSLHHGITVRENTFFGFGIKGLSQSFGKESMAGLAADIGITQKILNREWYLSLALKNFGPPAGVYNESYQLPLSLETEINLNNESDSFGFHAGAQIKADDWTHYVAGVSMGPPDLFRITAGVSFLPPDVIIPSAGMKIMFFRTRLDYSYYSLEELGDTHSLAVSYAFSQNKRPVKKSDKTAETRLKKKKKDLAEMVLKMNELKYDLDEKTENALEKIIKELKKKKGIDIELDRDRKKISVTARIQFDRNSAEITLESDEILNLVGSLFNFFPDEKVQVEGHSAVSDSFDFDMTLSRQRAENVKLYFVVRKGVREDKFILNSYGPTRPAVSNKNEAGRKKNDRVDITIHHDKEKDRLDKIVKFIEEKIGVREEETVMLEAEKQVASSIEKIKTRIVTLAEEEKKFGTIALMDEAKKQKGLEIKEGIGLEKVKIIIPDEVVTNLSKGNKILGSISEILKADPSLNIEFAGHSEKTGNPELDLKISEDKAKLVVKFLKDDGIEAERMKTTGRGSSEPLSDNDSEPERKKNNRVEASFERELWENEKQKAIAQFSKNITKLESNGEVSVQKRALAREAVLAGQEKIKDEIIRVEKDVPSNAKVKINIQSNALGFGHNTYEIDMKGKKILDKVIEVVNEIRPEKLFVTGHTDNIGTPEIKLDISKKRAEAVRDYILDSGIIEPDRVIALGKSDGEPAADNSTFDGRTKNNRVDIGMDKGHMEKAREEILARFNSMLDEIGKLEGVSIDRKIEYLKLLTDAAEIAENRMSKQEKQEIIKIEPTGLVDTGEGLKEKVKITVDSESLGFKEGQSKLSDSGEKLLDKIGDALRMASGSKFDIKSYTDDTGADKDKLRLSDRRAQEVGKYFTEKKGIPKDLIRMLGMGKANPKYSNSTEEGRKKNNRIETEFVRDIPSIPKEKVLELTERMIEETKAKSNINVEQAASGTKSKILATESAVNFDFDRHELKPEGKKTLDRLAEIIASLFEAGEADEIEISGHTDSIGTEVYNKRLSERRADSVVKYLAEKNIDSKIMKTKGYGKSMPVDTNDTEEGRAKNRRVEISIKNNEN